MSFRNKVLRQTPKVNTHDPYLHKMLRFYNRLFLPDGILVRALGERRQHPHYVVVVPSLLLGISYELCTITHLRDIRGLRVPKTALDRDWPGIRRSVQKCIKQCTACTVLSR